MLQLMVPYLINFISLFSLACPPINILQQMTQPDIHTPDNLQLSHKLSANNPNVSLFKNERLQRIKPRKKLSVPANMMSADQIEVIYDIKTHSMADVSTHMMTGYQSNFRTSTNDGRAQTTTSANRNFRKRLKQDSRRAGSNANVIKPMNNYLNIEKKNNKGSLEVKNMENWLNDILVEYCFEEKFDPTIQNPALKKFQIDRNSLLSKGIGHGEIDRIYRSLFVYSLGFNRLLDELANTSESSAIRKTVWRVYAMLLEYCARGEFETMVGEIERDKLRKIETMKAEIQKRQEIIDASEDLDKQRNVKIYKQIKQLKEHNQNLMNEKAIIQEDFKQADQAFNQQVGLRLKFEHKINEIHGVHRELGIKHMRLLEDFNNHKQEYARLQGQKLKQMQRVQALRIKVHELQETISKMRVQIQDKQTKMENLQYNLQTAVNKTLLLEGKMLQNTTGDRDKDRQLVLMKFQIDNLNGKLNLRQKSLAEQYKQVEVLINQNRSMYQRMEQQKSRIEELIKEQYSFELSSLNLKTREQLMTAKYLSKAKEFDELTSLHQMKKQRLAAIEIDLNIAVEKNKMFAADIENFNTNLEIMKKAKNAIEDELIMTKKQNVNIMEALNCRETEGTNLSKRVVQLETELSETKATLIDTQTKLKSKQQTFAHEKNILTKKYEKAKVERDEFARVDKERGQQMILLIADNQKCKQDETEARANLRNQIFERNNLELKFKQSMLVLDDETKYIKELNITNSHLKEEKDTINRKLKATEYILEQRTQQFKKEVSMLNEQISTLRAELERKRAWVHPMYYHDIDSRLLNMTNKYISMDFLYQSLIVNTRKKEEETRQRFKQSLDSVEEIKKQELSEKDKVIFTKDKQIEHLQEKVTITESKVTQLESTVKVYQQVGSKDDPKVLLLEKTIKERTEKLEAINSQNKTLMQRNAELNKKVLISNSEVQESRKVVSEAKEKLKDLEKTYQYKLETQKKMWKQNEEQLKQILQQKEEQYAAALNQIEEIKEYMPQMPSDMLGDEERPGKHFRTNSKDSADKLAWVKRNQTLGQSSSKDEKDWSSKHKSQKSESKDHQPQSKQMSEERIQNKSSKIISPENPLNLSEQQLKRQKTAEYNRRDMSRKIKGAFNYYHNIK